METNREWFYRGLVALFVLSHQMFILAYGNYFSFLSETFFYLIFTGIVLVYSILAAMLLDKKKMDRFRFRWSYLGWSLLGFLALLFGNVLLSFISQRAGNGETLASVASSLTGLLYVIVMVIQPIFLAPICEELIYRGLVMTALESYRHYYLDVLASTVLFGLAHVVQYDFVLGDFLNYSLSGLILALLFRKTRMIQYSIGLHMVWNAFTVLLVHLLG